MEIQKTDIVRSISGHDKGKLFYVTETENGYAYVVDGKNRKIESPKRKNKKHLRFSGEGVSIAAKKLRSGEKATNKEIRKGLAEYAAYPAENMEVC